MLSKLTFSLVFVLMLALVAAPAFAQQTAFSPTLNVGTDGSTAAGTTIGANDFVIYEMPTAVSANNGIVDDTTGDDSFAVVPATSGDFGATEGGFPDLNRLFEFGGTVELLLLKSDTGDADSAPARTAAANYRLAITEIMWGVNAAPLANDNAAPARDQWIEIYNAGDALLTGDAVRLRFISNQRIDNLGEEVTIGTGTYTVVDRVSVVNRFGARWAPKGQSGRTVADAANNLPVQNLVSMYRKRSTDGNGYKYKDGKPDGDKFADGTDGGQWIKSVGRINMSGNFVGTPGSVQKDDGGIATQTKDPASLPVGNVIINEIFNSEGLQWIELHNTGTAEANVKKHELEAVYGTKKRDRVFLIPDKDAKIPAGGFLVITNRDPADSILAGGVDLHDTTDKFNAGATHRYIVIPKAGDNKWMPEKGFLLVLRSENKDNHEKIVDIAGNAFVKDPNFSDVWPLKGWTVPGDRGNADEQKARWGESSLEWNVGKTYGRKEQKSRPNRLHKDDWNPAYGTVGGLGYDPGVDLAIAPGTPGYANNAQKDKPANIMGKIVISEVMYDAGANDNLVQWIELYNSSMTESATLNGWELEIRNIDTDVESYVDSHFKFDADAVILPNQTLLLVSDRSSASDVPSNRVYNLYQKHRNDIGLSARKSILLSSVGFYLRLDDKDGNIVDEAGNVMLDGPRRTVQWALPETGGDMRSSIIRGFGERAMFDGTPSPADDGTMESSWHVAQSVGSYYGHRDDVGSPGHREGSPLPVSLSSFRPVRDKATGEVVIRWVTESELNNAGFNILRSETKEGEFKVINVKGIIAGHGTTSEKHVYTYTDTTAKPNIVYYYQIEDVSLNGERTTLRTTHLRGNVSAGGKLTTRWGELKSSGK